MVFEFKQLVPRVLIVNSIMTFILTILIWPYFLNLSTLILLGRGDKLVFFARIFILERFKVKIQFSIVICSDYFKMESIIIN